MHALEFKALLCVFCPPETRPQMACKMYLSLLNMNLELPADALFPAAGCRVWLVEIRQYYTVKLPDMPPSHACSLKKTSPHIPWAKSLQLVSVGKGGQHLGFWFPCHKHHFNYISCGQAAPRILTLNKHVNSEFKTNACRSILAHFLAFKHRIHSDYVTKFGSKSLKAWKV